MHIDTMLADFTYQKPGAINAMLINGDVVITTKVIYYSIVTIVTIVTTTVSNYITASDFMYINGLFT